MDEPRIPPLPAASFLLALALLPASAPAQPLTITHLAGSRGGPGWVDATGTGARFFGPCGAAADGAGNLYFADEGNNTIRRVVPATGAVSTVAGTPETSGSADGTGSAARFHHPCGLALDGSGNLYVADVYNHAIRRIVIATGAVSTLAGAAGAPGSADGVGAAARFQRPYGLAYGGAGILYVADTWNDTIRRIDLATRDVSTLAGTAGVSGHADGTGEAASFTHPMGLAAVGSTLYVTDSANTIRKILVATRDVSTFAGTAGVSGSANGIGAAASFRGPWGISYDGAFNLWIADNGNHTIRKLSTQTGVVTTVAGQPQSVGSADGIGAGALFYQPAGIVAAGTALYVGDLMNNAIRRVDPLTGQVTTIAGMAAAWGSTEASGSNARFYGPSGVSADGSGNVFVVEYYNQLVRKIVAGTGAVTTIAGGPLLQGSADGIGAAARFRSPAAVVADGAGNLYVADQSNHTIRKVVVATRQVSTFAGTAGAAGIADGIGGAARFNRPAGLALDGAGSLWVCDSGNNTIRRIVVATRQVFTFAGSPSAAGSADGTGGAARFQGPLGIAADGSGRLWVTDYGNATIRQIDVSTAAVTTPLGLAGYTGDADGIGNAARFNGPNGIALDGAGGAWVVDGVNGTIRKVDLATLEVSTPAGTPGRYGSMDGTGALARFHTPSGIAADASGLVFVADSGLHAIRRGLLAISDAATIDTASAPVGEPRQLDTLPQTAVLWAWEEIEKPSLSSAALSSTSVRNPTFTPDAPGRYVFRLLAATNSAYSYTTASLDAWAPAGAAISGGGSVCAGQPATIQAQLTGASPWDVTWSDGVAESGLTTSPAVRSVAPLTTTTYTVTAFSDTHGTGSASGAALVAVTPDTAAPVVTPPAALTVDQTTCCGSFGGATAAASAALAGFLAAGSATDDCDPSPLRLAPRLGGVDVGAATCFEAGRSIVTFRYQDVSSNVGTASADVTVRMFADLNLDATADPSDMVILRAYFNFAISPGTPPFDAPLWSGDLNHDGVVDPTDLVLLRAFFNFAVTCLAP